MKQKSYKKIQGCIALRAKVIRRYTEEANHGWAWVFVVLGLVKCFCSNAVHLRYGRFVSAFTYPQRYEAEGEWCDCLNVDLE